MVGEAAINPLSDAIASMIERAIAPYVAELTDLRNRLDALRAKQLPGTVVVPPGCLTWDEARTKRLLSIKQTAYLLEMSDKSVRRKIKEGTIKASKGLRCVRIPVEEIDAYQKRTV